MSIVRSLGGAEDIESDDVSNHGAHRNKRIKLAAGTSIASKVVTMSVNIFALPLALHALGVTKFGVYAMIGATLGVMSIAQLGIGPGLTLGIAGANAKGDMASQKRYFSSAMIMISVIALVVSTILLTSIWVLPTSVFFGHRVSVNTIPELRFDMTLFVLFVVSRMLLSVTDAAQAGYQEQYVCNLWAALGNFLSLMCLLFVSHLRHAMIFDVIIAVNAMPIIADICNGSRLLLVAHPQLRPSLHSFDGKLARYLMSNGIAFTAVVASSYMMYAFGTVMIGHMHGPKAAALYGVLQQCYTMGLGLIWMFTSPLWPALNDSKVRQDRDWAVDASRKVIRYGMVYALGFGIFIAVAGGLVFKLWYHSQIHVSQSITTLFGIYFVLAVWEFVHYNVLVGMNKIGMAAVVMIVRSLVMLTISPFLIFRFGNCGLLIGMCIAQLCLSTWIFPILAKRALLPESFYASFDLVQKSEAAG